MIRYWEYLPEYENDRREILDTVDRVFSSGRLILGSSVEHFEKRFSEWCGVPFGIGVNSGTDALFLALKALDIGAGDEVITVANTAVPTVAAIRAAGARPVFVDVEEDTFLMDPGLVEALVTPRTRCLLPVHLLGQAAAMDPLLDIAQRRDLAVVEDCAQAAGARYRDRPVGSFGNLGAFSFYPTKVLGGYGDGGMIVTATPELAARAKRLRFYGMEKAYYSIEEGFNSRLDEIHAALLDRKLGKLDEAVASRRTLAAFYTGELAGLGDIRTPVIRKDRTHQFYAYTIRTRHRDRLQAFLQERQIETKINYPDPVHLMSGYRFLAYREGSLPVTERLAREILSLPLYPGLSRESAGQVVEAIREFFRKA
jgi:aminotransferase EvaB